MRVALLTTDNRDHHRRYHVAEPYFGPAIEAVLQGLAQLSELEVHVISCTQQPMHAPAKLSDNTWFHLLHVPKIGWLRTAYQGCIRAIRRKVRELRPDIVHGQGTERECAISAVFSGFPNVITIHGNIRGVARAMNARMGSYLWCSAVLERFTLPRTLGVFCNSAYTESMVRPLARRTWCVPNAIRREFFNTSPPARSTTTRPIILNVGTISPYKQQCEILELAGKLHREGYSFDMQFVGTADPHDRYAAAFLQRIKEAQHFAQHVATKSLPDLIAAFDAAAALVHAPAEEAFGLVVAEALARNAKVFGTNIGGIPDIAGDIKGTELFGNLDSLGSAVAKWLRAGCPQSPPTTDQIRWRYHPQLIAQRHLEIYHGILASA